MSAPARRTLIAAPCPDGLLLDTAGKLLRPRMQQVVSVGWRGRTPLALGRYGPLPGNSAAGDLDAVELYDAADVFGAVLLYQHVLSGPWAASGSLGALHGAAIALFAQKIGYPVGATIGNDMENLSNVGQPALDYCFEKARAIIKSGWTMATYEGFAAGASSQQLADVPGTLCMISDFGHRKPPTQGFAMEQHPQETIAGMYFDPNDAHADALGRRLLVAILADPAAPAGDDAYADTDPGDPAAGPVPQGAA